MQHLDRRTRTALARWIATLVMAVLAAVLGREYLPGGGGQSPTRGPPPERVAGAGRPIDGDSLFVGRDEVRLKGIDAPEGRQECQRDGARWACGTAAHEQLRDLIGKDVVQCRVVERDRHQRLLAFCTAGNRDLNSSMVAAGMAVAYGGYVREEGEAKARKKGLWNSQFERPRAWRDEHRRGS
ncbi:MAG: thermonuclease family protein [Hyphomicrobium sp.]